MKTLEIKSLHRNITLYIAMAMLMLTIVAVALTTFLQHQRLDKQGQEYSKQIHLGIEHATNHFFKEYIFLANRLVNTTTMREYIKSRDRDGLYKLLKPKWDIIKEEEEYFSIMNIYLADGTSFLRMNKPENFGDNLLDVRPMLKEIHDTHKNIHGYGTGIYKIISPIFDEKHKYIGAFEVGLNPQFILRAVKELYGFCGMVFINEKDLKLVSSFENIIIDGYRLQSSLTKELEDICEQLEVPNALKGGMNIYSGNREYMTYLYILNNDNSGPSVKLIFFQDISKKGIYREPLLFAFIVAIVMVLLLLIWLVYRRIDVYQNRVSKIYKKQNEKIGESKVLLVESQSYLQTMFDVIPNIMITSNGKIIDKANPAMLKFFEFETLESFRDEHECICDFFLGDNDCITATMGSMTWLEYILSNKNTLHKACMLKDAKRHHFVVWAELLKFDDKNRSVVMFSDVTELEEAGTLLSNIIGSIDNLMFVKDKEFKYINCNSAFEKFIGKSKAELIGRDDYDFFPKEEADYFRSNDKKMILDGVAQSSEKWIRYADGEERCLLTSISPLRDSTENILGLVGNSVDITLQKRLEQELRDKEEMMISQSRNAAMGEMISMIAHQWRQPISVIAMGANNILADVELDMLEAKTLKATSKDIVKQTQELSKTIDDFRNFFRPENKAEEVFIKDTIDEALGVIGKSLENNGIELVLNLDSNAKISIFSREFMQVLINILKNAKEAFVDTGKDDAKVVISLKEKAESIIIDICDNAGGVPEDLQDKIFNPYFTTKGEKNGTGIGLYMSKIIIQKHLGGELSVKNMDDGACFKIVLPLSGVKDKANKKIGDSL